MVGEGTQPCEGRLVDPGAAEDRKDAEDLVAEDQRLPGKAANVLAYDPVGPCDPLVVLHRVTHEERLAARPDTTDFHHAQREAAEIPIQT